MLNTTQAINERATETGRVWPYWLPVVAWAGMIFYLSSQSHPDESLPSLILDLGDRALHGIEYGILSIFCYRAFRHAAGAWAARYAVLLAIVTSTGYGFTDEVHQAFVPFRQPEAWDVLMDAIGATVGAAGWRWMGRWRGR